MATFFPRAKKEMSRFLFDRCSSPTALGRTVTLIAALFFFVTPGCLEMLLVIMKLFMHKEKRLKFVLWKRSLVSVGEPA